jgi:hypothetical protein
MTPAPTPAEVEQKCEQYRALDKEINDAVLEFKLELAEKLKGDKEGDKPKPEQLADLKTEIIELVRAHGSAHAEKSKILHGITLEAMGTFGSSTSIDAAAVERFRLALVKAKLAGTLKKVFEKTIRWTLNPEAAVIVKGEKLSTKLLALYSQCEVPEPKTPTLKVREKSA